MTSLSSRGGPLYPNKPGVADPGVGIISRTGPASQVDIVGQQAGAGYAVIPGTSMAPPHVAGLLPLFKHGNPNLTASQFKQVSQARGRPDHNSTFNILGKISPTGAPLLTTTRLRQQHPQLIANVVVLFLLGVLGYATVPNPGDYCESSNGNRSGPLAACLAVDSSLYAKPVWGTPRLAVN